MTFGGEIELNLFQYAISDSFHLSPDLAQCTVECSSQIAGRTRICTAHKLSDLRLLNFHIFHNYLSSPISAVLTRINHINSQFSRVWISHTKLSFGFALWLSHSIPIKLEIVQKCKLAVENGDKWFISFAFLPSMSSTLDSLNVGRALSSNLFRARKISLSLAHWLGVNWKCLRKF